MASSDDSADKRVRDLFERQEMARRDQVAREKWLLKQQQTEFAKKLLSRNRPIEEIIEDTGLTREVIEGLK
ncbi:MAG: hypothetical protein FWC16_01965 [Defluviitaleaceae bacterium]|nr:hypothetical protein [Defluviitaleaceae bacterium]MCL2273665.1 hypothetical protein [Defluviitaleaceae bacterium]